MAAAPPAISALTALGYSVVEAQAALQSVPRDAPDDVEERLRLALHSDALLAGRLEPRRVVLEQGAVSLARAEDGSFGLRIGGETAFAAGTPASSSAWDAWASTASNLA